MLQFSNMKYHINIAIIGSANAGKSSLLNSIIESKNSIVSPKPHTTRRPILGFTNTTDDVQLIFIDTPGYVKEGSNIWSSSFIKSIRSAVSDADVILIIIDALNPNALGSHDLLSEFATNDKTIVAINKLDTKKRMNLYPIASKIQEYGYNDIVFLVSAKTSDGLQDLLKAILQKSKNENWLFEVPEQAKLTKPQYAAECVREKIFHCLNQEIPFQIWTHVVKFSDDDDKWEADIDIYVARDSHKKIVIGKNGDMIKRIGIAARVELISKWGDGNLFLNVEIDRNRKKDHKEIHRICMVE